MPEYDPKKEFSFFLQLADLEDPLDLTLVPSNPNFNSEIAFLCDRPEDFWTLAPIVKAMPTSEFVFINSEKINNDKGKKLASLKLNHLMKLASRHDVHCRLYFPPPQDKTASAQPPIREARTMLDFFERYSFLVGARCDGPLSLSPLTHKKKMLFCENPAEWLRFDDFSHLDAVATTGSYPASLFSIFAPSRAIGSPRLEAIKNRSTLKSTSSVISSLIYLPSTSNLLLKETVDYLINALPDNISFKIFIPHFRTISKHLWKQNEIAPEIEIFFLGDKDPAELIADSDAAIIENSAYLIDCIFLEKPLILLDQIFKHTAQFDKLQQLQPQESTKSFGVSDPTVADFGIILKDPANLSVALEIFEDRKIFHTAQETQKKLKEAFIYSPKDGAIKATVEFIVYIENMPRSEESFLSRTWKHEKLLSYLNKYYRERFGITSPLGNLTTRIFRLLTEWEQEK